MWTIATVTFHAFEIIFLAFFSPRTLRRASAVQDFMFRAELIDAFFGQAHRAKIPARGIILDANFAFMAGIRRAARGIPDIFFFT